MSKWTHRLLGIGMGSVLDGSAGLSVGFVLVVEKLFLDILRLFDKKLLILPIIN